MVNSVDFTIKEETQFQLKLLFRIYKRMPMITVTLMGGGRATQLLNNQLDIKELNTKLHRQTSVIYIVQGVPQISSCV